MKSQEAEEDTTKKAVVEPVVETFKVESVQEQFVQDASDHTSVPPMKSKKQIVAKKTEVTSFFAGFLKTADKVTSRRVKVKKIDPGFVKFTPSMNRNGLIKLVFDKKMQVPPFGRSGRRLNATDNTQAPALSNIDVQRDLLNLNYILKSDQSPKDVEFYLILKKWDEDQIHIQCNFTNPLEISKGLDRDTVYFNIKNPEIFISKDGAKLLNTVSK